ncbi:ABC transporter ATP-binding protein [Dyadobacter aurulentus]|uniref:ABC transporter ATP-binding protein n=1 Tax=Dyadobacter sp. UC 10 TaxID=2605428 RepID=UPI0011F2E2AA|nr:ABC transporter ATP-binding protein [Dyadobacter sp. UC 10]KAA0990078.1 ABC transporter ATP-binding protein [Dyadobacter sp. UC 10]
MKELQPLLTTTGLSIGYRSKKTETVIARDLDLNLQAGQMVCLLGANGSGKSTLMRTLAGLQPALAGQVLLGTEPLTDLQPQELATKLSLVLTERLETGNLTAREVIELGRTPYTGWLGKLSEKDKEKVGDAVAFTGSAHLLDRHMNQLSDGERQKVMLARALAQDTGVIMLDEPTAHLDLPSRIELMKLLHYLASETQKAILLSTHELDLALQTADQLWLMEPEKQLVTGVPEDLILNGCFESAFNKNGILFDALSGNFVIERQSRSFAIELSGSEKEVFWTKKALHRAGIKVDQDSTARFKISVLSDPESGNAWDISFENRQTKLHSLAALLHFIEYNG